MSLPQKRLSMKSSPALVLQHGQRSFNGAKLAGMTNPTRITLDEQRTEKPTFSEDFTLEHSRSGPQITSKGFAGFF